MYNVYLIENENSLPVYVGATSKPTHHYRLRKRLADANDVS